MFYLSNLTKRSYSTNTHIHVHTRTHTYMHTYIHAHIHTCTHTRMHTYIHAHIHTCTHTYMHTWCCSSLVLPSAAHHWCWFRVPACARDFSKKLSLFTEQYMGTWLSSELGKVKGGDEEEWCPTSVTPFPGTCWVFNSHFPGGH